MGSPPPSSFTGRPRNRRTRLSVRLADYGATFVITCGGIGTIAAISGIFLYLAWIVWPLFSPVGLNEPQRVASSSERLPTGEFRVSESEAIAWMVGSKGRLTIVRPDTGEVLATRDLIEAEAPVTASDVNLEGTRVAFGLADGTVRLGQIHVEPYFLDSLDPHVKQFADLQPGERTTSRDSVVIRTPREQLRRESVVVEFPGEPVEVSPGIPIARLDRIETDGGPVVLAWSADGKARVVAIGRRENLFTGEMIIEPSQSVELPMKGQPAGDPLFVGLGPRGATATLLWADGSTWRFDLRDLDEPKLVERTDITPNDGWLTAAEWMVGRLTLLVGDAQGRVTGWFPVRTERSGNKQVPETRFVLGHALVGTQNHPAIGSAVTSIAPASRSRLAAIGYADGSIRLFHVTTEEQIGRTRLPVEGEEASRPELFVPPGEPHRTLYAVTSAGIYHIPADVGYPEATPTSFFAPIQYESYGKGRFLWQTSASSAAVEPKFGMMPLVFGTLKATFYSMLFGVPLAMLAALYTSEFLSKKTRGRVKPVIEIMASLPSVVLGFLAAMVFAPIVENWLAAIIASAITIPVGLLLAARIWQAIPQSTQASWTRWRLPLAAGTIAIGFAVAALVSGPFETLLFAGDVERWLTGQIGSGLAAWMVLTLPLSLLGAIYLSSRVIRPRLLTHAGDWGRGRFVLLEFAQFLGMAFATIGLATFLAWLFTIMGLDPRGEIVDTYVQRNALVVGFVMGFAIIPIIYTLADDALHAVPSSLRSASLGAGATHWQTAIRVVVPAAMSGLFSAMMVGLGRAVGETMIVLMAAGNTPIMEINIFNGFQTLSAAIATEMPEAVRGSGHFRTLFFAALVLFSLTFLVNTVAEMVRLRFRRRVVQL